VTVLVNLTPHTVRILTVNGVLELPPDGPPARLVLAPDVPDGMIQIADHPVPLVRTAATPEITGLPAERSDTLLLVARVIAEALPDRDDLVYPHVTVRNEHGLVTACRSLGRPARPHR